VAAAHTILPAIGLRRLGNISRSNVERLHGNLVATPIASNRIVGLTSAIFTLAER
jgi:hypothetical protein